MSKSAQASKLSPKNVTIFTNFQDYQKAYSLTRVVEDQIKMLLRNGYKPNLIVAESFEPPENTAYVHPDLTIKKIPIVPVHNEVKKDETFDEDVTALEKALEDVLKDTDVVITHDIIYQNACLKHNFAARRIAKKYPTLRWLHWIHSATSPVTLANLRRYFNDEYLNLVQQPFPNSYYVFFNDYSKPRIAQNFGVSEEQVRTVHHPTDVYEFLGISQEVQEIADTKKFLESDALCVYPIRLDRGKQVEYVIKTMAMLKEFNLSVRVVIIDFHSTGGDKLTYRDELKALALDWGLNAQELTWTSESRPEWEYEVPHSVVRDFMMLGNVFIIPSRSESYSLIAQEAGLLKNIVVFNYDFPPFRDIFGSSALFRAYGSEIDVHTGLDGFTNRQYRGNREAPEEEPAAERRYHHETAGKIVAKLKDGGSMELSRFLIKNRNLDVVFKRELEPLLFG